MSFVSRLRVFLVCVALEAGVLSGVPMRPDEIQDLMQQMNQAVLAHVLPSDDEGSDGNGLPDVAGEWLVQASFDSASVARGMPAHVELVCTFERQDRTLKGSCRPSDGPAGVPVEGTIEGRHVEWHFDIAIERDGKKQRATYSGVLNDAETSMKGMVGIADMRGEFTAKKEGHAVPHVDADS